jgi:hypothetical protein
VRIGLLRRQPKRLRRRLRTEGKHLCPETRHKSRRTNHRTIRVSRPNVTRLRHSRTNSGFSEQRPEGSPEVDWLRAEKRTKARCNGRSIRAAEGFVEFRSRRHPGPAGIQIAYLGREGQMETLVIGGALLGSFVGAFVIQKAALESLFRILGG